MENMVLTATQPALPTVKMALFVKHSMVVVPVANVVQAIRDQNVIRVSTLSFSQFVHCQMK